MDNIILIGMPGCGKSTCGVLAAKQLCKSFIDTDLLIQEHEHLKLQDIINQKGSAHFAHCEEEIITGLYAKNCVIATGGSVVYSKAAMRHLKSIGTVIYLKISYKSMKNRIRNPKTRGILLKDGETLRDMYEERRALYEQYADITIECDRNTIAATVEAIIDRI